MSKREDFILTISIYTLLGIALCWAGYNFRTTSWSDPPKEQVLIWPEVFTNPNFKYDTGDYKSYGMAVADGLVGWGLCHTGFEPPKDFGVGMVKISNRIDGSALPENLMKLSNKYLDETDKRKLFNNAVRRKKRMNEY